MAGGLFMTMRRTGGIAAAVGTRGAFGAGPAVRLKAAARLPTWCLCPAARDPTEDL